MGSRRLSAALRARIRQVRLVAFDFDGVFTDNLVYVSQDGAESVRCYRGDGIGVQRLQRAGIDAVIISTETNPVVTARSRKLGLPCVQGAADKRAALDELAGTMAISLEQVSFVGNDINDLPCLTAVGLPIVVADAHPDILPYAKYRTAAPGGHGAVREVCDLLVGVITGRV